MTFKGFVVFFFLPVKQVSWKDFTILMKDCFIHLLFGIYPCGELADFQKVNSLNATDNTNTIISFQ